jgi:ornithine carbamoyltransferase
MPWEPSQVRKDLEGSLRTANVVYTDCWPTRTDAEARERISREFSSHRITAELLDLAPPSCVFLPCPPVTRGEEVSDDAMTNARCKVYEAKDYLLHAQNALMSMLLTLDVV